MVALLGLAVGVCIPSESGGKESKGGDSGLRWDGPWAVHPVCRLAGTYLLQIGFLAPVKDAGPPP